MFTGLGFPQAACQQVDSFSLETTLVEENAANDHSPRPDQQGPRFGAQRVLRERCACLGRAVRPTEADATN